jgi:hypothetical protein
LSRIRSCVAWRGVAWRGVAWRGVAWRGVAWRGVAWRGVAWRGVAWRGVALSLALKPDQQILINYLNSPAYGPLRLPARVAVRSSSPTPPGRLLTHPPGSAEPAGGFGLTLGSDG